MADETSTLPATLSEVPGTHGRYVADVATGALYSNIPSSAASPRKGRGSRMGGPDTFRGRYVRVTALSFNQDEPPTDEWLLRQGFTVREKGMPTPQFMFRVMTAEAVWRAAGKALPEGFTVDFKNDDTLDDRIDNLTLVRTEEVKKGDKPKLTDDLRQRILREMAAFPMLSQAQIAERLRCRASQVSNVKLSTRERIEREMAAKGSTLTTMTAPQPAPTPSPQATAHNGSTAPTPAVPVALKVPGKTLLPRVAAPVPRVATPETETKIGSTDPLVGLIQQAAKTSDGPLRVYEDGELFVFRLHGFKIVAESAEELATQLRELLVG